MSLTFSIIPFERKHNSFALELESKIRNNIVSYVDINIDTDYDTAFSLRLRKWRLQEYNVIMIDDDYEEKQTIMIRYCDRFNNPETINIEDFIELISCFEMEEGDDKKEEESNCIVC